MAVSELNTLSEEEMERVSGIINALETSFENHIIGKKDCIHSLLEVVIAEGHALIEGVPGLAKTRIVKTLADTIGLGFSRIQFTPDLLPSDLTGTLVYDQKNMSFYPRKGPIFSNIILADEINRAPAKVQSALLEAMEEKQVTLGDESHLLPHPFFVFATQNPIEHEGTYPLPEAELDRFLYKVIVTYPLEEEELSIVTRIDTLSLPSRKNLVSSSDIEFLQQVVKKVSIDPALSAYAVKLVRATRPNIDDNSMHPGVKEMRRYIEFGASPRASIALFKASRARALCAKRSFVLPEDIQAVAKLVLRHRIVTGYEAGADEITQDSIISKIISFVKVP